MPCIVHVGQYSLLKWFVLVKFMRKSFAKNLLFYFGGGCRWLGMHDGADETNGKRNREIEGERGCETKRNRK